MAHPHQRNPYSKLSLPIFSVAAFIGLLLCWNPRLLDREEANGTELLHLSSRVMLDPNKSRGTFENLPVTPSLKVASDSGSPRVSPDDKISLTSTASNPDAGDGENYLSSIEAARAAEKQNKIAGIRSRILSEAAKRALNSAAPWADLSLVALAFKKAGDEQGARYWFDRASRLAMDPDDPRGASRALREVVKNAVSAGYYDIALELIARIPEATEKSRARAELVKVYARSKKFAAAHQLAMSLGDTRSRGVALRSIAEYEARYDGLDAALQTLQSITDPSERDRAFSSIAGVRAGMGDSDGAMSLLDQIKESRTRDTTVARIATIQERGGAVSIEALTGLIHDPTFRDQALRAMIIAEASRLGIDATSPSVKRIETAAGRAKAYESLVMLQLRQGDVDGALARAQSIRLEAARFRALQAVAVAGVQRDGAGPARHIANLISNFKLRETTYGKIAQRAAIYGRHDAAVATIQYIDDPAERALAYANVALTQARYGHDRDSRVLVQDANRELTRVVNIRDKARTQGLIAEAFAETGDANSALTTAASIENSSLRDVTYQRVALTFAKVSRHAIAARSAHLIERETTRDRALASVATTLAGKVALTEAVRYAARLNGHRQQVRFLLGVAGRKS